jgi:hypothetical protein
MAGAFQRLSGLWGIGMSAVTDDEGGGAAAGTAAARADSRAGSAKAGASRRLVDAILDLVGRPPQTKETLHVDPPKHARRIANRTAAKAALSAGTLALPPGPLGWLTILPELETVWRQQAQMVADIAGSFGKAGSLDREQMLYCLFRHIAPSAFRDMVTTTGERVVFHPASPRALRAVVQKVGLRVSLRLMGKGISRWVPVVGALGVGAYAYYDTGQVAATAMALFATDIEVAPRAEAAS